jgi:hypothetical protein
VKSNKLLTIWLDLDRYQTGDLKKSDAKNHHTRSRTKPTREQQRNLPLFHYLNLRAESFGAFEPLAPSSQEHEKSEKKH